MGFLEEHLFQGMETDLQAAGVPVSELNRGLNALRFGAARLALEMGHAESMNVSLSRAVRNAEEFPTVHKFHLAIIDLLTLEIPLELEPTLRRAFAAPPPAGAEGIRHQLAKIACGGANVPERALARLLLFEAVRVNVVIETWHSGVGLLRLGIDDEVIDVRTEENLKVLIENADVLDGSNGCRPLHLLVASTLARLNQDAENAMEAIAVSTSELRDEYNRRAQLEALLRGMDARDAVLIRNYFAPVHGEQRLEVDRLMKQHPLLFRNQPRNTVDQRLRRRLKKLPSSAPMRTRPALIDLLAARKTGV